MDQQEIEALLDTLAFGHHRYGHIERFRPEARPWAEVYAWTGLSSFSDRKTIAKAREEMRA
jgi:hypothetical protein